MEQKSGTSATDPSAVPAAPSDELSVEHAEKASDSAKRPAEEPGNQTSNEPFEGLSGEDIEEIDSVEEVADDTDIHFDLDWDDEELIQGGEQKRLKRWVWILAAVLGVVALVFLTLWWLFFIKEPPYPLPDFLDRLKDPQEAESHQMNTGSPVKKGILVKPEAERHKGLDDASQKQAVLQNDVNPLSSQASSLAAVFRPKLAEISRLRTKLIQKQKEIRDLQKDYDDRIHIVEKEILDERRKFNLNRFDEAIKIKAVEYGLRTIQRRKIYINHLNIPYNQLHFASEELLFLERLSEIELKLQPVVKGINTERLIKRIDRTLKKHRDGFSGLTVPVENLPTLDLKLTWEELLRRAEKGEGARREAPKAMPPQDQMEINGRILEEISEGEFSRKRYLTWLSPKGANALSKWSGKVLFLNGLSNLHASSAEKLVPWKGNWLCLNGLKEISPDTARHLAKWQGKRLSLNGLKTISSETAKELSGWRGTELEMVGLTDASPEAIKYLKDWAHAGRNIYFSRNFRIQTVKGS